jgi:hypothetical protein
VGCVPIRNNHLKRNDFNVVVVPKIISASKPESATKPEKVETKKPKEPNNTEKKESKTTETPSTVFKAPGSLHKSDFGKSN